MSDTENKLLSVDDCAMSLCNYLCIRVYINVCAVYLLGHLVILMVSFIRS